MQSVKNNLEKLAAARVLVVGDVMLDQYWMGSVDRISPEAPVPIVTVTESETRLGGAGNVARNIVSLGGSSALIGIIGQDDAGRSVTGLAGQSGINALFQLDPACKTTVKLRVVSKNQQLLRADFEDKPDKRILAGMLAVFRDHIENNDAVVLSDYGKGGLANPEEMISITRRANKPILIDPRGNDYSRYRGATLITPNLAEFESVVGKVESTDDFSEKAASVIRDYDLEALLVTLSDEGMTLFERNKNPLHIPARSREVYDVSGAGDTVIGVMAMVFATNLDKATGLEIANSAAGVVISKFGTTTATRAELMSEIRKGGAL